EPFQVMPYPEQTTRVTYSKREDAVATWGDLVVGQGADIAILDDVLLGDRIADALSSASVGRLVFVRTDWLDGKSLLSYLTSTRPGPPGSPARPFALLGLPRARREGARVWAPPDERAGGLSATILSDEDRDAIVNEKRG